MLSRTPSKCLESVSRQAWAIYNEDYDGPRERYGEDITTLFRSVAANTKGQIRRWITVGRIPLPSAPMLDIMPTPEFMRACREVLGLDVNDPTPLSPRIVIPAMRDETVGPMIQQAYERIIMQKEKTEGAAA
jgi:hypothetical protein